MKYGEFSRHQVIEAGPYVVTEAQVLEFAMPPKAPNMLH